MVERGLWQGQALKKKNISSRENALTRAGLKKNDVDKAGETETVRQKASK